MHDLALQLPGDVNAETASYGVAFVAVSHSPFKVRAEAAEQGLRFRAAARRAADGVRRFDPELVVFFGMEHRRTLTRIVPQLAVVTKDAVGYGDYGLPADPYQVASHEAEIVLRFAIEHDFDVAAAEDIRLDHGFGDTMMELFGSLDAVPVVPILLNCAQPPLPRVARTIAFARLVGLVSRTFGKRILFVGSGGLSHNPPLGRGVAHLSEHERVQKTFASSATETVDRAWDTRFLNAVRTLDWSYLESLDVDPAFIHAGGGANEVRSWLAALAAAGIGVDATSYEPVAEWITGMGVAVGGLSIDQLDDAAHA